MSAGPTTYTADIDWGDGHKPAEVIVALAALGRTVE